jgi:hypothetical protein
MTESFLVNFCLVIRRYIKLENNALRAKDKRKSKKLPTKRLGFPHLVNTFKLRH